MIPEYTKAVGSIQELFQELSDEGKITPIQAEQFDEAQRVLVNFHEWVKNQVNGTFKVELPWDDQRFADAWNLWVQYKKQQFQFTYKAIAEQSALKHLAELSSGDMNRAIYILEYCRKQGWRGIFLPRENFSTTTKSNNNEPRNVDYKQNLFNRLTQQK